MQRYNMKRHIDDSQEDMCGGASGSAIENNDTAPKKLKPDTVRRKRLQLKMRHLKLYPNDFTFSKLQMPPELSDMTRHMDNVVNCTATSDHTVTACATTDTSDVTYNAGNVDLTARHVVESTNQHSAEINSSDVSVDALDADDHKRDTINSGMESAYDFDHETEDSSWIENSDFPLSSNEEEGDEENEDNDDEDEGNFVFVPENNNARDNTFALRKKVLSQKLELKPNLTVQDVVAETIAMSIRFNWTYVSLMNSLRHLNSMMINNSIPKSINGLWSLLCKNDEGILTRHYYCEKCLLVMGTKQLELNECICKKYGPTKKNREVPYFIQVSLASQLRQLLETPSTYKALQYRSIRKKKNPNYVEDIYDGKEYKKLSGPNGFLSNVNNFSLTLNTDGYSVAKSSNASAWSILIQINELPPHARKSNILLGGIWVDQVHPHLNILLTPTMKELKELYHVGVQWTNPVDGSNMTSKFVTVSCSVDTPARSDVLNMTSFNGQYGCTFCYAPGITPNGKAVGRVYPSNIPNIRDRQNVESTRQTVATVCERRTDAFLRKHMREAHEKENDVWGVKGPSSLMILPKFNLSSGMIVESMHSLYLGMAKLHMTLLLRGKSTDPWYIGTPTVVSMIDDQLMAIQRPSKISKAPRSTKEMKNWEADEWRNWLLYYAVVCLKNKMHLRHVNLLSLLSRAAYIYNQDSISTEDLKDARSLINDYVKEFQRTFGDQNMRFNVHLLTHLAETVENWGPLWAHNAFPFESFNKKIIDSVTSANARPLQIVTRHLMSTFVEKLLHDPSVQADTKKKVTSILYGGGKKAQRRNDDDDLNDNTFSFQGKGRPSTRAPSDWESQALQNDGIDNAEELTCYRSALIRGIQYERHDRTSTTNKRYCDKYIYCQFGFARINDIVQVEHNNEKINGFFVQIISCLGAVCNVKHIQNIELSTQKEFIRIVKEPPTPAIRIRSNSGDYIVKLANVWESD